MFACGGDDDGGGNGEMCVGAYASIDSEQFAASANSTGACFNESDLLVACVVDLSSIVGGCGLSCFGMNMNATPEELGACTATCVKNSPATVTDPSDQCLDCYVQSVGCTLAMCKNDCLGGASSPSCVQCRATKGCTSAFFTCSGLPVPPTPDGG
jgi:hypothetical protein